MKAKPFVKWVGGKTQLIDQLEAMLPADFDQWENVTYIEPFVGEEQCSSIMWYKNCRKNNKNHSYICIIDKKTLTLQRKQLNYYNYGKTN